MDSFSFSIKTGGGVAELLDKNMFNVPFMRHTILVRWLAEHASRHATYSLLPRRRTALTVVYGNTYRTGILDMLCPANKVGDNNMESSTFPPFFGVWDRINIFKWQKCVFQLENKILMHPFVHCRKILTRWNLASRFTKIRLVKWNSPDFSYNTLIIMHSTFVYWNGIVQISHTFCDKHSLLCIQLLHIFDCWTFL